MTPSTSATTTEKLSIGTAAAGRAPRELAATTNTGGPFPIRQIHVLRTVRAIRAGEVVHHFLLLPGLAPLATCSSSDKNRMVPEPAKKKACQKVAAARAWHAAAAAVA